MIQETINKYYDILEKLPMIDGIQEENLPEVQNLSNEELAELQKQAEAGDSKSQLVYGIIIIVLNKQELFGTAIKMFENSADQGDTMAETMMGYFYEYGVSKAGYPQDYRKAFYYYEKAALKGYMRAEYALGWFYEHIFFYHDYDKAIEWYKKALEKGHPDAEHRLNWLLDVKSLATHLVQVSEDMLEQNNIGVKAAKEEKFDEAFRIFFNCACNGMTTAVVNICHMLGLKAVHNEQDIKDGMTLIERYASYECPEAISFLSACYAAGNYVEKDEIKANELIRQGAECGDIYCIKNTASKLLKEGNIKEADQWFQKGYEKGDVWCAFNLGIAYFLGDGVTKNISKSKELLTFAQQNGGEEQGLPVAQKMNEFGFIQVNAPSSTTEDNGVEEFGYKEDSTWKKLLMFAALAAMIWLTYNMLTQH